MKTKNKVTYIVAAIFAAIIIIFSSVVSGGMGVAYAATSESYTGVLEDLKKDSSFNVDDYPRNPDDYSMRVIQVAESTNGELYVYTYQPCQYVYKLYATEINMSLSQSADGTQLYKLDLIESRDTFCKYKVNGFTVSKDKERYYNITSIYRPYDRYADGDELSSMSSIVFKVAQCWTAVSTGNNVTYSMLQIDVIELTGLAYGSIRVAEGSNLMTYTATDVHVIVFSTDIKMDRLLEADVEFDYRSVDVGLYKTTYGEIKHEKATITYKEKSSSRNHFIGNATRTWDKIQSTAEFSNWLSSNNISVNDDMRNDLDNNEWVLAFYNTEFSFEHRAGLGLISWALLLGPLFGEQIGHFTQVGNATVLRLEFVKDGSTYNLGAVSNKTGTFNQKGGSGSDAGFSFKYVWRCIVRLFAGKASFTETVVAVIAILLALLAVALVIAVAVLIAIYCPGVYSFLWRVICAPFKAIKALIDKKRGE